MQQRAHAEFDGGPGGSTCQSASEFMRKTIGRPAALAELKRLTEHGFGGDYADFLPVVGFSEIAVPTFLQILWIEVLGSRCHILGMQYTNGKQPREWAHHAIT